MTLDSHYLSRGWAPVFSLAHPSARSEECLKMRDRWIKAASRRCSMEYVICADWGAAGFTQSRCSPARLVWNYGKQCSVDATNAAAAAAVGRILVVISDDTAPCEAWDQQLMKIRPLLGSAPCVVRARHGLNDHRGLCAVQILNRARYESLGYVFHPAYVSMYADDDFGEHAMHDGVLVDAPEIMLHHEHPRIGNRPSDEIYERQCRPERYDWGGSVLLYRRQAKFSRDMPLKVMQDRLAVA